MVPTSTTYGTTLDNILRYLPNFLKAELGILIVGALLMYFVIMVAQNRKAGRLAFVIYYFFQFKTLFLAPFVYMIFFLTLGLIIVLLCILILDEFFLLDFESKKPRKKLKQKNKKVEQVNTESQNNNQEKKDNNQQKFDDA